MEFEPEFESIEAFAEFLFDDERETFTAGELVKLCSAVRQSSPEVRAELESYGLQLANRPKERHVRGINANPHDRWFGPGSCPTHGGCGIDAQTGTASRYAPYQLKAKKAA